MRCPDVRSFANAANIPEEMERQLIAGLHNDPKRWESAVKSCDDAACGMANLAHFLRQNPPKLKPFSWSSISYDRNDPEKKYLHAVGTIMAYTRHDAENEVMEIMGARNPSHTDGSVLAEDAYDVKTREELAAEGPGVTEEDTHREPAAEEEEDVDETLRAVKFPQMITVKFDVVDIDHEALARLI